MFEQLSKQARLRAENKAPRIAELLLSCGNMGASQWYSVTDHSRLRAPLEESTLLWLY